jgi:hypothetical protein
VSFFDRRAIALTELLAGSQASNVQGFSKLVDKNLEDNSH